MLSNFLSTANSSSSNKAREDESSFQQLSASELYCPKCGKAMPVREKLLLYLPSGDISEFTCVECGTSLGRKVG